LLPLPQEVIEEAGELTWPLVSLLRFLRISDIIADCEGKRYREGSLV
jgi:hypothetical protein